MMYQEIDSIKSVGHLDHNDPAHLGIFHLKRHCSPLLHGGFSLFHGPFREIYKLNLHLFRVCHILIPVSLFIFCKTDPHAFASCISLINGFCQKVPVDLDFNRHAGTDIQHCCTGAERQVVQMEFLCYSQRVYFVSFSCSHHFIIPPINESRAFSYAAVSL